MSDSADTAAGGEGESRSDEEQRARRSRIEALKRELMGGDLFSAAEVAEILDIHPRTVSEYVREGKLHALQIGGAWKISEQALRAFVREQTQDQVQQQALDKNAPVAVAPSEPEGKRAKRSAYRCSFCGKRHEQVRRLIAGPNYVYICDACVGLCNEILAKHEVTAS